jgi:hypothetical protein
MARRSAFRQAAFTTGRIARVFAQVKRWTVHGLILDFFTIFTVFTVTLVLIT